jgi:hypothetical protein
VAQDTGGVARVLLESLRDVIWLVLGSGMLLFVGVAVFRYGRRRKEKKVVHRLLAFLRGRRVLYSSIYQEYPVAVLESVLGMQKRLGAELERLPARSRAFWPVREMNEACLGFLARIEPLSRIDTSSEETELLSDRWVEGIHWQTLGNALAQLRSVLNPCIDELYEEYDIEKPLQTSKRVHAVPQS